MRKAYYLFLILIYGCTTEPVAQHEQSKSEQRTYSDEEVKIAHQLQMMDSLLFDAVFNQCDTEKVKELVSADLEFYHDKSGVTITDSSFIRSIKGLCANEFAPSRVLEPGSLDIFLMKENDQLYGAVQTGRHLFYEKKSGKKELTSTARFTHLWILEKDKWKLKRVISYFHQVP